MKKIFIYLINIFLFSPLIFLISSSIVFFFGFNFDFSFNLINSILIYSISFIILYFIFFRSNLYEDDLKFLCLIFFIFLFQFLIFFYSFKNATFPHHAHDASNHAFMTKRIIELKRADTVVLKFEVPKREFFIGGERTATEKEKKSKPWYPLGLHTGAAFLCDLFKKENCLRTPWYLAWIYASMAPVIVYYLAKLFFDKKIGIISSLLTTIYYLFPYMPFGWGGFGMISGLMLMGFGLYLWNSFLRKENYYDLILASIVTVSIFYVHSSEVLTLFLLVLIGDLASIFDFLKKFDLKKIIFSSLSLIFITILIIPAYKVGHQATVVKFEFPLDDIFNIENINFLFKYHLIDVNNNLLILFLIIGGILFLFQRKLYFHPIILQSIFFILLVIFLKYWSLFQNLMSYFYPWGQFERIFYTTYLLFPIISGVGFFWYLKKLSKINLLIFIFITIIFYLNSLYFTTSFIRKLNENLNPVTYDDIKIFDYINKNKKIFKNALFYNNPFNDAGAWLYEATNVRTFFPTASSAGISSKGKKFLYLFYERDVNYICNEFKKNEIDYLFKGAKNIPGTDTFFVEEKLKNMKCIDLLRKEGNAKIYRVLRND